MKFRELSEYLRRLESTSSRIEITKILAELFKKTKASEIDKTIYLILGILAPSFRGVVFNLAEKMMLRVVAKAYSSDLDEVKKLYRKTGDIGDLAYELGKSKSKGKGNLSVDVVYKRLVDIAQDSGEKSQERKVEKTAELLGELDPASAKFIARIPVGRLRLGFSDKTIIDALSWALSGDKSKRPQIEKAYQVIPDVGLLAKKIKEQGIDTATTKVKPVIGIPVLPMLAQRIKSPTEMIKKMGKVFVEPKFDGLRVLIHFKRKESGDEIHAFTRNLNNVYQMFPELGEIGEYIAATELILDTEAVGLDPNLIKLVDFQTTMKRRRKYDIENKLKEIPLRFQVFDVIYKDGKNYMGTPYHERRKILAKTIKKNNLIIIDEAILTDDPKVIKSEHKRNVKAGLEGVIVKKYDTAYIPGRTGWRWVKMKQGEEAVGKLADTLDCVVMGYSAGRGKRTLFGLGQFLVGVKDKDEFKTVTKVGTGLTDEQFRELNIRLNKIVVKEKPREYLVNKILEPDYWVEPEVVVEIAADEITKSPAHTAGLALRFPRLVKFRDDKSPQQATTLSEVKKLYKMQKR